MDFLELQRRLRAAGYDTHLAYDGRYDHFLPAPPAEPTQSVALGRHCQGAWNLYRLEGRYVVTVRDIHRPSRYPPDETGPEPVEFRTEAEACAYLWDLVSGPGTPRGVRDFAFDELPAAVADWVRTCGAVPTRSLFGNPFVATHRTESYRLSRVGDGYELRKRSDVPPTVGRSCYSSPVREDVCRVLMTLIGDDLAPRRLGLPKVGFARTVPGSERVRRLAGADYADIARAYGADRGEPLLDVLAEGAALDLVTPEILRMAEEAALPANPYGDGRSITFGVYDVQYRISGSQGRYLLERAPERQNRFSAVLESSDLDEVREEFLRVIRR